MQGIMIALYVLIFILREMCLFFQTHWWSLENAAVDCEILQAIFALSVAYSDIKSKKSKGGGIMIMIERQESLTSWSYWTRKLTNGGIRNLDNFPYLIREFSKCWETFFILHYYFQLLQIVQGFKIDWRNDLQFLK